VGTGSVMINRNTTARKDIVNGTRTELDININLGGVQSCYEIAARVRRTRNTHMEFEMK